jgi:hypothetical protein
MDNTRNYNGLSSWNTSVFFIALAGGNYCRGRCIASGCHSRPLPTAAPALPCASSLRSAMMHRTSECHGIHDVRELLSLHGPGQPLDRFPVSTSPFRRIVPAHPCRQKNARASHRHADRVGRVRNRTDNQWVKRVARVRQTHFNAGKGTLTKGCYINRLGAGIASRTEIDLQGSPERGGGIGYHGLQLSLLLATPE